jgi:hypothetical protein
VRVKVLAADFEQPEVSANTVAGRELAGFGCCDEVGCERLPHAGV